MSERTWLANAINRIDLKLCSSEGAHEELRRSREAFVDRLNRIECARAERAAEAARIAEESRQDWARREDGKSKAGGYGQLASNFRYSG